MKVKNIAFSGFAAAILGGVCGATDANAAIQLVSPEYVTKQLEAKQDVLKEGTNITIADDNTISANFDTKDLATKAEVQAVEQKIPTDTVTSQQLSAVEQKIPTDTVTSTELSAVEQKIPTDYVTENDLSGYATTGDLANKQNKLTAGSGVTIDELTNTISADTNVVATKAAVEELAAKVPEAGAVSESDVANKIAESLANYTKTENLATVAKTGQYADLLGLPTLITRTDLDDLQAALQTEIAKKQDAGDFATVTQLQGLSTELSNFKGNVYTKEEVDKALADAVTNGTINLEGYATVASLNELKNSLKTVATTGSYNDLTDKPTIPTTVAQLTDASDYAKSADVNEKIEAVEGQIETLNGDIPTQVSELENDSKYISGVGAAGNYIVHLDGNGNVTWKAVEVIGKNGEDMLAE